MTGVGLADVVRDNEPAEDTAAVSAFEPDLLSELAVCESGEVESSAVLSGLLRDAA